MGPGEIATQNSVEDFSLEHATAKTISSVIYVMSPAGQMGALATDRHASAKTVSSDGYAIRPVAHMGALATDRRVPAKMISSDRYVISRATVTTDPLEAITLPHQQTLAVP